MDQPAHPPIGQRIREERLKRGINLRGLARSVNVSASHISQIETGKCQPSVSTLYAITTALQVPIEDIFGMDDQREDAQGPVAAPGPGVAAAGGTASPAGEAGPRHPPAPVAIVPRTGAAAALVALAAGARRRPGPVAGPGEREVLKLDSGVTWERLGHVPDLHVDFLLITYAPGSSSSSTGQLMRHPGIEHGYLISGELTVTLGFSEHQICSGDAVCFPSSTPHRYRNDGAEPAVGVWFVADPDSS